MDVEVSKQDWDALDDATKKKISDVITNVFKGSRVVPTAGGAPITSGRAAVPAGNPVCEFACNVAENTAKVACLNLVNPIAIAACIAAVEAAGRECRKRC